MKLKKLNESILTGTVEKITKNVKEFFVMNKNDCHTLGDEKDICFFYGGEI